MQQSMPSDRRGRRTIGKKNTCGTCELVGDDQDDGGDRDDDDEE